MSVLKEIEFWNWLYSSGNKPLSKQNFEILKQDFVYVIEEKKSEFEGKPYTWNFETLRIELPIRKEYTICVVLHFTESTSEFEEYLYIKYNKKYYVLGWLNSNNHDNVFSFQEFYQLLSIIKNTPSQANDYSIYFLLLARYVALTNEEEGITLVKDAIACYYVLQDAKRTVSFTIDKIEPYRNKILNTDLVMKWKKIKVATTFLSYFINEGVKWVKQPNGVLYLEGFAANSTRTKYYKNGLDTDVDIYDVEVNYEDYKFPIKLIEKLLDH